MDRVVACEIGLAILEVSVLRALAGGAEPAAVSSLKIQGTEAAQHITELFLELAGHTRLPALPRCAPGWPELAPAVARFSVPATASYFFERAQTIYGGATEVPKNIIWRQINR